MSMMHARVDNHTGRRIKGRQTVMHHLLLSHYSFGQKEVVTRDLSLTGAFVEGQIEDLDVGERVDIAFEVADNYSGAYRKQHRRMHISAVVMRTTEKGVGLRFDIVDGDLAQGAIYKIMHQQAF